MTSGGKDIVQRNKDLILLFRSEKKDLIEIFSYSGRRFYQNNEDDFLYKFVVLTSFYNVTKNQREAL